MSVAMSALFGYDMLDRRINKSILGFVHGTGFGTGDASAGDVTCSWSLPSEFVYLLQAVCMRVSSNTAMEFHMELLTGHTLGTGTERYEQTFTPAIYASSVNRQAQTWIPPKIFSRGDAGSTYDINISFETNVNTLGYIASFRALAFDQEIFQRGEDFDRIYPLFGH